MQPKESNEVFKNNLYDSIEDSSAKEAPQGWVCVFLDNTQKHSPLFGLRANKKWAKSKKVQVLLRRVTHFLKSRGASSLRVHFNRKYISSKSLS